MKIKSLHIYGYGQFVQTQLQLAPTLQVIFGENEAGKSTIMSFIHSILFGFPTKQQTELRYEPKTNSFYGGRLIIEMERYGEVSIERVKGKATGDVTVLLEDGRTGKEKLLQNILGGLDKEMFQGVFSFDMDGLQKIQRLKEEELTHYLFAAGTIGTDTLMKVEQRLQKDLDRLFKPNGRKPLINEHLRNLREREKDLKKAKQHNDQYLSLVDKKMKEEQTLHQKQQVLYQCRTQLQKFTELKRMWPLYKERNEITSQLVSFGRIQFPIDGQARLEKLEDQLHHLKVQRQTIKMKKQQLEKRTEKMEPNTYIEKNESKIIQMIDSWHRVLQWKEDVMRFNYEIQETVKQIMMLKQELHIEDQMKREIEQIDISINMKEQLRTVLPNYDRLLAQQKEGEEQLKRKKDHLATIEAECAMIEKELLSEETFRQLEADVQQMETENKIETNIAILQGNIQFLEKQQEDKKNQKNNRKVILLLFLIAISGILFMGHWRLILLFVVFGIGLASFRYFQNGQSNKMIKDELVQLYRKVDELEEQSQTDIDKKRQLLHLYDKQRKKRNQWKEAILRLENEERMIRDLSLHLSEINSTLENCEAKLNALKKKLGLSVQFPNERLEDALEHLRTLLQLSYQSKKIKKEKTSLENKQKKWEEEIKALVTPFIPDWEPTETGMIRLRDTIKKEHEKRIMYREANDSFAEIEDESLRLQSAYKAIMTEINTLLKKAEVDSVEQFRVKGKKYAKYLALKDRLTLLSHQLDQEILTELKKISSIHELDKEKHKLREKEKNLLTDIENMQHDLAARNHEIKLLEEGGTYTEKLHQFYQLQSTYNDKAKEWATYALAKKLLTETMNRLRKDRFPKVINRAEKYIAFLTDGRYIRLHLQTGGAFLVERADRMLFEPKELSKATAEQLYISIRFALAHTMKKDYPFPIIIDEGFVSFDHQRTKKVMQLLKTIANETQVLFFTCHEHLLSHFSIEQIIELKTVQV